MSFDKPTRNALGKMVGACRRLLTDDVRAQLQQAYGLQPEGQTLPVEKLPHLDEQGRETGAALREWQGHLAAQEIGSEKDRRAAAFERMAHETAFTVLNRLAALRMCEERGLVLECVRRGMESDGFALFDRQSGGALGPRGRTYRAFLECLFDELAVDLGVLFDRRVPQSLIFPGDRCLAEVQALLNAPDLAHLWKEDETVGWIYQFFNSKEEREAMRKASSAPRNTRELAVRNQFFTPRYVVEFLTDNTLGRLWYEMRHGDTRLKADCRYLVHTSAEAPVPTRSTKDPRDFKTLDPACGSGHFLLYAFDLLETIYEEAWACAEPPRSEITGTSLRRDYPDWEVFRRHVPELILRHNLYGTDIDARACQIAALALWLRAQQSYQRLHVRGADRPRITKTNLVCAEPMPGEPDLFREFVAGLQPRLLGQLAEVVVDKMRLAGEAGSLLRIEEEIEDVVARAKKQWRAGSRQEQIELFPEAVRPKAEQLGLFDVSAITDEQFWTEAEGRVLEALQAYPEQATDVGGFQRRLFAEDAAQGFAFVDLCRNQFDVVLMNPPFGEASKPSKAYIDETYPRTKNDVYAAFVERGLDWLVPGGLLGAITSRTGFFLSSFQKWREEILLKEARPTVVADLGQGVLDTAMVETAAYCLERL